MGDCYFHSLYWNHRGEIKKEPIKHNEVTSSEELGYLLNHNPKLQKCINGTTGIFYYEFDLEQKEELRKRLHLLIDEVLK